MGFSPFSLGFLLFFGSLGLVLARLVSRKPLKGPLAALAIGVVLMLVGMVFFPAA